MAGYGEMFTPGAMRFRVVIEAPEETRNSLGEVVKEWNAVATVWASIQNLTGREVVANSRQEFVLTHRVVIRFLAGILPSYRLVWGDRRLEISSVLTVDRTVANPKYLELLCSEVHA